MKRKQQSNPTAKTRELMAAEQALRDKWADMPKFAGKFTTAKKIKMPVEIKRPVKEAAPERIFVERSTRFMDMQGVGALKPAPHYTGTAMKGISQMHKSIAQPVFDNQTIIDNAHMRR